MGGGGGCTLSLPFTQNIMRQPIPENSWPWKPFCCGCTSPSPSEHFEISVQKAKKCKRINNLINLCFVSYLLCSAEVQIFVIISSTFCYDTDEGVFVLQSFVSGFWKAEIRFRSIVIFSISVDQNYKKNDQIFTFFYVIIIKVEVNTQISFIRSDPFILKPYPIICPFTPAPKPGFPTSKIAKVIVGSEKSWKEIWEWTLRDSLIYPGEKGAPSLAFFPFVRSHSSRK